MEEKMKRLMELLNDDSNKVIKESEHEEWEDDDDDDWVGNDVAEFDKYAAWNDEEVSIEIDGLCSELFITNGGRPNYSNIKTFEKMSGYEVGPGESDSFGWLTGVVYKGDTMYHCFG